MDSGQIKISNEEHQQYMQVMLYFRHLCVYATLINISFMCLFTFNIFVYDIDLARSCAQASFDFAHGEC